MSHKSRRRAETSRRRVALAAGALLAGAAIPIAAAGTAWADQTSDGNTAPGVPIATAGPAADVAGTGVHPNTSPDVTLSASVLESQYGLSTTEATAVSNAEFGNQAESVAPSAVEVSVDGKVIVDVNQGTGASTDATATSGAKTANISIAIGGGSTSSASGAGALAFADGSSADGNSDKATAKGADATATINAGGTDATGADVKDTVTATGTDATASITDAGASKTTASGTDAHATINANGPDTNPDTKDVATAGSYSTAVVQDSNATTATATGTGSYAAAGVGAFIADSNSTGPVTGPDNSGDSNVTVRAVGTNSNAEVDSSIKITASASGTNAGVFADDDTGQGKVTASGAGAYASAGGDTGTITVTAAGVSTDASVYDSTNSTATARGTNSDAWVDSSTDSSATSTNDPSGRFQEISPLRSSEVSPLSSSPVAQGNDAGVADATDSHATTTGAGSTAIINPDEADDLTVIDSSAKATNGGTAFVENDGATLTSPVSVVAGDSAVATGPGSSSDVVDSQTSALTVNNGQSYEFYGVAGVTETNQSLGTPPAESAPAPTPEVRLEPSIALP